MIEPTEFTTLQDFKEIFKVGIFTNRFNVKFPKSWDIDTRFLCEEASPPFFKDGVWQDINFTFLNTYDLAEKIIKAIAMKDKGTIELEMSNHQGELLYSFKIKIENMDVIFGNEGWAMGKPNNSFSKIALNITPKEITI